jgi:hypothetical protein
MMKLSGRLLIPQRKFVFWLSNMMPKSTELFTIIHGRRQIARRLGLFLRQWIEYFWRNEVLNSPGHQGAAETE